MNVKESKNEFIAFFPARYRKRREPGTCLDRAYRAGPWDGARVALQRCPILRPGQHKQTTEARQTNELQRRSERKTPLTRHGSNQDDNSFRSKPVSTFNQDLTQCLVSRPGSGWAEAACAGWWVLQAHPRFRGGRPGARTWRSRGTDGACGDRLKLGREAVEFLKVALSLRSRSQPHRCNQLGRWCIF